MATRADYRTALNTKMLGMEDEGYGDFEYTSAELDMYLDFSVARMFPAVYQRKVQSGLTITGYGSSGYLASVDVLFPDRVFRVEDASEQEALVGWEIRSTSITGINKYQGQGTSGTVSTVNVYYYDAYTLPDDDVTDAGIAEIYKPLIVLGALVEALESRHDTGAALIRNDGAGAVAGHGETPLLDRLTRRYETLKRDLEMGLPAVIF